MDKFIEEPDFFKSFIVYFIPTSESGGCSGEWNNCLYQAISVICKKEITKAFPKMSKLKQFLGLEKRDPVHYSRVSEIEDKIKVCISVTGDHEYISEKDYKKKIEINLQSGHYSAVIPKKDYRVKGIAYIEKKPAVYRYLDGDKIEIYDGTNYLEMEKKEFVKDRHNCKSSKYTYITINTTYFPKKEKKDKNKKKKEVVKYDTNQYHFAMEETFKSFIRIADKLKEITQGKVNMYKTGETIQKAGYKIFLDDKSVKGFKAEKLEKDEAYWIKKASTSALIYSEDGYTGPLYKYDINKMYAAIMKNQQFQVPIKRGEFIKMTQEEFDNGKFIRFGIYRAIVSGNSKAFRYNPDNFYTHYDLNLAREILKLNIELIQTEEPNALIYEGDSKVNSDKLLKDYINQIMDWINTAKDRNEDEEVITTLKYMYQRFWGYLGKKKNCKRHAKNEVKNEYTDEDGNLTIESEILYENLEVDVNPHSMKPLNDNITTTKFLYENEPYDTPFARIAPFIISRGRKITGTIIAPHLDSIKRIHTDGFYSTQQFELRKEKKSSSSLDDPMMGDEVGDIRYEGFCEFGTINKNRKIPDENFII
ncbi:hypothetical protein DLAC_05874 [Tieghemostelium lacteum]|uniref:DNA-directed DNA polymerase n=1 Tax=Tieghemostelium lacteum TaxID=361077 RepID=A0A151ZH76_TIELA|nr:hypothetical protein DLAC_05874 [Tieghemostelium lacteum]|eukprot:KYQ93230.1 hypothetical protein DLAC_05874 [Tieghemostelium lacteum]